MRNRFLPVLLLLSMCGQQIAVAQTTPPANTQMRNGTSRATTPVAIVDTDGAQIGTSANPLVVTSSGGGGGGGSDPATATNQTTQNTTATETNNRLGATTSPAAGSVNGRLNTINSTLGNPFQAGGSIGNASFGATQSGAWNILNITGTVSLPTGAATSANQPGVATTGSAVPSTGTLSVSRTSAGNGVAPCVDANGVICAPRAGTSDRVITKTSVAATTSTQICPTATNPVTTEIQVSAGPVGLGLNGQTLTAVAAGTATGNPDIRLPAADTLYTSPVALTNAVTAYSAATFIAVCIQTVRQ